MSSPKLNGYILLQLLFTVNLWQVEPLGDDIVPPMNLIATFEQEALKPEEPRDSNGFPSMPSLPPPAKQEMTPPPAQHATTPETVPENRSEHPGSEAEEASEEEVPYVVVAPPVLMNNKKFQERLRRVFQPRLDGTYKVPEELIRDYKSKAKRGSIEAMFEKVGCDPDRGSKT